MEHMLVEHIAGMCRMKLRKKDVLQISEVVFVNKQFEMWHPEIKASDKDLTLDSVLIHLKDDYRNAFKELFEQTIQKQETVCQCKYKMAGPQGTLCEHILSCTLEYIKDEIIVDCVEISF